MLKKIQYNSPVILTFTFISLVALILGYFTKGYTNRILFSVYRSSPKDILTYVRVFTHVIGHANFNHFINNFMFILILGPMLEEKYGSKNLVIMIIITAFITGILNIILFNNALLGASGVVFMLILLSSFANMEKNRIPLTFIMVLIFFIGKEIYGGIILKDNISQITHIIGGLCGSVFGYKIKKNI